MVLSGQQTEFYYENRELAIIDGTEETFRWFYCHCGQQLSTLLKVGHCLIERKLQQTINLAAYPRKFLLFAISLSLSAVKKDHSSLVLSEGSPRHTKAKAQWVIDDHRTKGLK